MTHRKFNLIACFVLPLVFAALILPAASRAEETPRRTLTMTGMGEVRGAPGKATISTGVVSEAATAAAALAANSKAMAAAIARLKALGIADRDLQTSNFSVVPRYFSARNSKKPPSIVGYTVSNQLAVVVRELSELGQVLDAVVSQGANQISGPRFGFDDPEKLRDIARARAAADALRKANLYASALGVTLGPILSVSETGRFSPRPIAMAARMESMAARDVPIEAGELGLNAQVNIVWEIK